MKALRPLLLIMLLASPAWGDGFIPAPGIPTTATVVTKDSETSTLVNSRQLVAGTNTTIDTATPGQIKVNATTGTGNGDSMSTSSFVVAGTAGFGFNFTDGTGGAFALTLPTAVGNTGKIIEAKKTDATGNLVTVTAAGGEFVDGAATYVLSAQYQSVSLISNGIDWYIK